MREFLAQVNSVGRAATAFAEVSTVTVHSHPPGISPSVPPTWRNSIRRLIGPVERYLDIETSSGILLMIAAVAALALANSPLRQLYEGLWHLPLALQIGDFRFERDLHFVINDGLMTLFFFVVGLEIRRETYKGELSDIRRAALPVAAALGGMVVPALIYLALNANRASSAGWAIPMATDIAFAVGVLALLGKRVPHSLRILLLALAIIDDVGAIVVIALFYSTGLEWGGLAILGLGILAILAVQRMGVRKPAVYIVPAVMVWTGALVSGLHPTLAGVIVGLMTPVRAMSAEAVSPAESLLQAWHGWVAFGIMPLFAFANAGISLSYISFSGDALFIFYGIVIGLVVGKPLGILSMSWAAARMKLAALPQRLRWQDVGIVGGAGGIGFTMALFIADLAFPEDGNALETAKFAILVGSTVAAGVSFAVGNWLLKKT